MFRIIIWLFEIGVLATLASVALAYVFARSPSLAGLLRAAATVVIAGVVSGLIGMGFGVAGAIGGAADPLSDGLIAMILSLPLTVWALDRAGRRRVRVPRPAAAGARTVEQVAGDDRIAAAWRQAVRLAPMQRLRLAAARDACLFALRHAEGNPLDVEAVECAVLIRRRLPELVDQTARYCTLADKAERRAAIDGLVGDLESLGRMALRRVEQSKVEMGDTLAATRAHIASRTSETATF